MIDTPFVSSIYAKLPRPLVKKIKETYTDHVFSAFGDEESRAYFWMAIREAYLTGREVQLSHDIEKLSPKGGA